MNIDTGSDKVLCTVVDGVATLIINRPEARNALGDEVSPALRRMIRHAAESDDVGALLITGAGTAFCAGGDVKGMNDNNARATPSMTPTERVADLKERQRLLTGAIVGIRKPTIAALPGAAAGAGLAIALACDMRIAAASAFIATGYARIGLSGDYGISWLLTRAVGNARARELMFLAERIDSAHCERYGLFNRVVPDAELRDTATGIAQRLANGPRLAYAQIKNNLDDAMTCTYETAMDTEAERLVEAAQHSDHKEAVKAFVAKRKPVFGRQPC
ncbi:MAG: enoyl-CoA hydratase-related protein [Burkholderiaceae bacterium]